MKDKIIETELAYVGCFSNAHDWGEIVRFTDADLPSMYAHNLTYIKADVSPEVALDHIARELDFRRSSGKAFLNIHTDFRLDQEALKSLGMTWNCRLSYYVFNMNHLKRLKVKPDLKLIPLDQAHLDDALNLDLEMNGEELGQDFIKARFIRRSKVYLNDDQLTNYIAYLDGKPVAHVDLFINEGVAKIEDFDVSPDYQRQGLGTSILKSMVLKAKKEGVDLIYLITDFEETAKVMYKKCGMKHIGDKQEYFFELG